jgi:hypothetical protein
MNFKKNGESWSWVNPNKFENLVNFPKERQKIDEINPPGGK